MTTTLDDEFLALLNNRTNIMVLHSHLRERKHTVEVSYYLGINLHRLYVYLHRLYKLIVKSCFKSQNPILCTKNLFLVFLEFLSDITLCLSKSLLANPLRRYAILEGVSHFKIIAKYVVISYFERRNTCTLSLFTLYLQQIVLARG